MNSAVRNLKGIIWRTFSVVAYWSGVGPLWARNRRKRSPSCWTVLTYHRIGDGDACGGPDLVSRSRFRMHLRYVRSRYKIVTVGEALKRLMCGDEADRPLLSITFDDGYADNVAAALPALESESCRATLFPTVEAIRDGLPPWPHRLTSDLFAISQPDFQNRQDLPYQYNGVLDAFIKNRRVARSKNLRLIRRTVELAHSLPALEAERLCDAASEFSDHVGRTAAHMMTVEDLERWHKAGMEVGSHTTKHHILARLPSRERVDDLTTSKRFLEKLIHADVDLLAYPNGRSMDWDQDTISDAKASGFRAAVTTIEGINRPHEDLFRIKRISIGNDSLPVFAIRVSGLFSTARAWLHARSSEAQSTSIFHKPTYDHSIDGTSRRPMRIAFIGGRGVGSAYSGIERYYEEIGSRLAAKGHCLIAYCRSHYSPQVNSYRGIKLRRLPTVRSKHLETLLHTLLATLDVCLRKVDIVQFHALGSSPFAWIPRLFGKRCVVSVRGLDWQRSKWGPFARAYLKFCELTSLYCPNATVVVSKSLRQYFRMRFGRHSRYIPNGVNLLQKRPASAIRKWGLGDRNYLLYAGRISPEKRLEGLIRAHQSVASGCRLVIAGGSSYTDQYIKRVQELADGQVLFTGFVTGEVLEELYSNALAFVLPSQMEGLSVALLEAFAYGVPAIVSDIPENRELVDEFGGFLFRVDDEKHLAQVIKHVAADKNRAARIGQTAQERVRASLSWDLIADETEHFYRSLVSDSTSTK